ncbi:MAG: FAD-dependent monooxygenase [Betaproteobacteria bacterium]|nr:FAD-dependent monooxygenase [Betaproteobacteria bacterium]
MVGSVRKCDIVIIGGGLNGAALALALSHGPHTVTLVEMQPPTAPIEAWDARIYAYSPGNVDWLRGLGGWDDNLRQQAVHAMRVHGDAAGRLTFDALETGLPALAFIAENRGLQWQIWQALQARGVSIVRERPVAVAWGEAGMAHRLCFGGAGVDLEARLLVAAEGANSWLRQQAGIGLDVEDYHQSGVVANFECERPHRGIAWQWFRPDGILAYLPLPGRRLSIVWSTPTEAVAARLAQSPEALAREVAEAGDHALGALRLITPAQAFPLRRRLAHEWVRPGLVLLGDAAHTVHPLAGQGVNLGFRDSRLLAEMLARGGDPGEIGRLQSYALRRREDVFGMQAVTGQLKRAFYELGAPFGVWRNTGMTAVDAFGPLKQALMRHAVQ